MYDIKTHIGSGFHRKRVDKTSQAILHDVKPYTEIYMAWSDLGFKLRKVFTPYKSLLLSVIENI